MQHRQEEDAFQGKLETPAGQQSLDDLRDLQLVPQPPEDQGRTDAVVADGGHVATAVGGEHHDGFGELRSRLQEAVELPVLPQLIESAHRGHDTLLAAAFFPAILDDLQIDVLPGSFLAEEHGGLRAGFRVATMIILLSIVKCQ